MKILQGGDLRRLEKPIRFECKACGCVFEADHSEYKHLLNQRENYGWYECVCPTCHKLVAAERSLNGALRAF